MLLFNIEQEVLLGNINPVKDNLPYLNDTVDFILKKENMDENDIRVLRSVINIFNIIYNNSPIEDALIDDGIYDMLVTKLMNTTGETVPGAPLVDFKDDVGALERNDAPFCPVTFYDKEERAKKTEIYVDLFNDSSKDRFNRTYGTYYPDMKDISTSPVLFNSDITRRTHTAAHGADTMVGTLDKCKFVLNSQAKELGVFDDPNVRIFERDFIQKHIQEGIIKPDEKFFMVAELKYDGTSVEAEVSDHVISARSRGDTNNDIATDYTAILEGYRFPLAEGIATETIGMKFEAILTNNNLQRLGQMQGKVYKNARNAIAGILGSNNGNLFRDYITLVPLECENPDLDELDRIGRIEFMNTFYTSGVDLKYAILHGDYKEILFKKIYRRSRSFTSIYAIFI